ncbi:DNA polymerase III subunit gamma/tau [Niabella beijingensis]|uniref:DNA polymerase III subunit gamma/tau n=1 Tax=Niabella beijingensis TaxID=2872700 RepID=UPI001CBABE53|nr:DNA polymerase III subunit gamma/tau [Niabella beijingensis]MBZ4190607.1 DNA polymerase III subunit gamma/tau [Niabella beijingensis]
MDKFIVSARKYRPQTFDTVVGQAHITTTLKNAIKQNQLAHAFLFCGPRGVGKTTCARILAKTINCEHPTPDGEACNECNSCVSFNQGTSLNIHELDAASNNSVDDIRTLVDQVRFAPQAGRYKVYIIDEVHMLSSSAFNAFLKTLEEPPPYAIFILATTEKHKILPTILSRCQIFDFKRITTNDTVEHLEAICEKEGVNAEKAALQTIAQKSEGCMRDALSIMDKIVSFTNGELNYTNTLEHLNILDEDYYFKLLDHMLQQDLSSAMLLYDDINRKGFEGDLVLNGFAAFIRNLLVSKDEKVVALLDTVESFKQKYLETAKNTPASFLISALNILNESEINYRAARNKRLHVELTLIKLCYLQQAMELAAGDAGLVKKKIADKAVAVPFRNIQPVLARSATLKETVPATTPAPQASRLIIEEPAPRPVAPVPPVQKEPASSRKISSLEKLRQQFKDTHVEQVDQPLTQETLQEAWDAFIVLLKENKNSAAQSFDLAQLKVLDDNSFYVYTANAIEYRFIESCKTQTSEFLQQRLSNTQLQFYITKRENVEVTGNNDPKPLTAVQQYQKMIEKYPLVKELKEKLKMELDR